jgi:phosphatidylglycerol:prolipoprotein diacylglycerol transferase
VRTSSGAADRHVPKPPSGSRTTPAEQARPATGRASRQSDKSDPAAGQHPGAALRLTQFGWAALADLGPQILGLTYRFDPARDGDPYPVTIRFVGRRVGVKHKPGPRDAFDVLTTVQRVLPGSGPVAVTTRIGDIAPGQWQVTAIPEQERKPRGPVSAAAPGRPRLPRASAAGVTGWAPVLHVVAPGVRLGAWPALVGAGTALALSVQALLSAHTQLPVLRVLAVSLIACLLGLVGAKLYYLALHRADGRRWLLSGMCIQGFVLAATGALVVGAVVVRLGVGSVLDVSAPGLMLGMTTGRFGCFLGGCCAGRCTASRWGLWSSDRRIGARRVPVQLLESAVAAAIGVTGLLVVWYDTQTPAGSVFVGVLAAYILGRQLLFPLRELPRQTNHGRVITAAVAGLVLLADLGAAVLS